MPYALSVVALSIATHAPLEKLQVAVLDRSGDRSDVFGSSLTDAQGRATIAFDLAQFPNKPPGHLPNIFFRVLDGDRLVHSTMSAPLEALAPGTYDFVFEIDLKQVVSEFCVVTGLITDTEGRPVAEARVRIVDCEMVTNHEVARVDTDAKGVYLHRYSLQQTSRDEICTADLRISVLDDQGNEIAKSPIVFNASEHQVIDLTVPSHLVPRRLCEWRWIESRTTAVAQGRATFQWTDENLDFLHFECGIDRNHLRWFRQDAIWSREHKLQPSLCYALLRMGEPEDRDALVRRTPNSRRAALKSAQAQNIIDVFPPGVIDTFLRRMTQLAIETLSRDPPPDASPALPPIGALLSGTTLPAASQRRIAEVALSLENPSDFLDALEKDPDIDEQAKRMTRFVVDSFELLGRHAPTVRALPQGDSVLDLARLTPQDWLGVVQKIGVDVPDPAAHAEALAAKVELAMPTAVVAHRMLHNPDGDPNEVEVGNFLLANPQFDLRMPVDKFLHEGADLKGIDDVPAFTGRLKASARLARIAPDRNRYDWIHGLAAIGLDSAAKVVAMGRAEFMRQAMPIADAAANNGRIERGTSKPRPAPAAGPSAASSTAPTTGAVFDNAYALTSAAQLTLARMFDTRTVPAGVMQTFLPHGEETNWTELFGSLNACLCDECESVHGPAAYLVDLVRFLRGEPSGGEHENLYAAVKARRPDIDTIELNCANAHTPIPYIDLINEILELAVAPPSAERPPEYPYQTVGDTDEDKARLRAEPAHLWAPAYETLAGRGRLFKLPFVLEHEETLLYAGLAGIDLVEAMTWLGLANEDAALARASLGLSAPVAALIAAPSATDRGLRDAWGEGSTDALMHVVTLVDRTGLAPDDLRALVKSKWFQPLNLDIDVHGEPCRIERHTLGTREGETSVRPLKVTEFRRILHLLHRFLRLRAALDIPAQSLSEALAWQQPLEAEPTDEEDPKDPIDLVNLARLVRLSRRLGVPLGEGGLASNDDLRRAMQVSGDDWRPLVDLHHGNPFEVARRRAAPVDLVEVEQMLDERDFVRDAKFDIAELRYLIRGVDLTPAVFAPTAESLDRWLQGIYDAMRRAAPTMPATGIPGEPSALPAPGSPEAAAEVARQKLLESVRQAATMFLAGVVTLNPDTLSPLIEDPSPDAPQRTSPALIRVPADRPADDLGTAAVDAFIEMVMASGDVALEPEVSKLAPDVLGLAETTLRRVLKAGRLVQLLALSGNDLRSLAGLPAGTAAGIGLLLDFDRLPVEGHGEVQALVGVRNLWLARRSSASFARRDVTVFSLIDAAFRADPPESTGIVAQLEAAAGWGETVVRGGGASALVRLAQLLGVHTADRLRRPSAYARLHDFVRWVQQRRLVPEDARRLSRALLGRPPRHDEKPEPVSVVLRDLARRRHATDNAWYAAITPAMDKLRARRRDALIAYLLGYGQLAVGTTTPAITWNSADELYAHFLIDVQMGPCLMSSRIVQAHNALQLFVQRCLFAIEEGVNLADPSDNAHWRQWEWMKHYRVWEAARKVFLYPENWIEPELLDEKSPPYRQLETALLQDEIRQDTAERAVRDYVQRLHEVARLEVMSLYEEVVAGEALVHVVARTAATPHAYFYRCRRSDRSWTAWEKIDLSIDAEQVVLVVHNRRPMLFWPTLTSGQIESETGIEKYQSVGLAWTTREQGAWGPPLAGTSTVRIADEAKDYFSLRASNEAGQITIHVFVRDASTLGPSDSRIDPVPVSFSGETSTANQQFLLDGCRNDLVAIRVSVVSELRWPLNWTPLLNRFTTRTELLRRAYPGLDTVFNLPLMMLLRADSDLDAERAIAELSLPLLMTVPDNFLVTPLHNSTAIQAFQPFVYADNQRQFLASLKHGLLSATKAGKDVSLPAPQYRFENFYHPYACQMLLALNDGGLEGLYRSGGVRQDIDPTYVGNPPRYFPRQRTRELDNVFNDTYGPSASRVWRNVSASPYEYPYENFDFNNDGAYATYNWEAFFHIPLLIADRLTKNQRFADAQRWLHYIFDPTDVSYHEAPQKYWRVKPLFEEAERWGGPAETLEDILSRLALDAADVAEQVQAWMADPFNPHRLARLRPVAYMKTVVFKYLDNLLAWGDSLFARFTMESINEAVQLYVLALRILGPRPVMVTPPPRERVLTVGELFGTRRDDELGNLLIDLETGLPPVVWPVSPAPGGELPPNLALYFCVPPNARLLEYWDTVEDRLFKIRHCQDLQGRSRQLPLFAPPIDPALLVRARAAGMDLDEVLAMVLNPTVLNHRFGVQLQRAMEVCSEVRALGSALLAALEKKDAEDMALLRARQESALLALIETVKQQQLDEANESLAAVRASKMSAETRKTFYATNAEHMTNASEETQLGNLRQAHEAEMVSHGFRLASAIAHIFPQITAEIPIPKLTWGGTNLGNALDAAAAGASMIAAQWTFDAAMAGIEGSHQRRRDEWLFQAEVAEKEIAQIDKQILAAEIRQSIAAKDLSNHRAQIQHAQAVLNLLSHKFTNAELHGWMAGQLSALHHEAYRLAFDLARRAEAAAQFELGVTPSEFTHVHFGHWDSLRKGLLAGERLAMELRRMEVAYMDQNTRRFEITKHISLRQLDATALMNLRINGACRFTIPESIFELDFGTHFYRCIKTVSLSVPCVVGPYAGVPATLTLESSDIKRKSGSMFPRNVLPAQAIATSSGQSDSGMFELNFRDERYLPFEGAGVQSTWTLRLPQPDSRPFDYDTISDVVMHLRYTARDGGGAAEIPAGEDARPRLLISLRHDFPLTWQALVSGAASVPPLKLSKALFPYSVRDATLTTDDVQAWFEPATNAEALRASLTTEHATLAGHGPVDWRLFSGSSAAWADLKDCFIVVDYTRSPA